MATPIQRYQPSLRLYQSVLPPIEYGPDDQVVMVRWNGEVRFQGRKLIVPHALLKMPIAFRPNGDADGCFDVFFCHHRLMRVNLRDDVNGV